MFGLGITELVLIVALIVLVFGARKIPLIARGMGEGIRNFKGEMKNDDRSIEPGSEDVDHRSD